MRNYFDKVALINPTWETIWTEIKKDSDGGWDFYKSFGIVAKHVPTFERVWEPIKNDLKKIFEAESNLIAKTVNKITKKEIMKVEVIGSLRELIKSGSRRGLPDMSNENYKKIIDKYGPLGARATYFKDLVIGTLKWRLYVGGLITARNFIANFYYEDDVHRCVVTKNIESKECKELDKNYISRKIAEWSFEYREDPNNGKTFWTNLFSEMFGKELNLPAIVEGDSYMKIITEIAKLDPGMLGNIANGVVSFINMNDNPNRKEDILKSLDEKIKLGQEELKKVEDGVDEAINNVDGSDIINKIDNTPAGFKAFVVKNYIDPTTKKSKLTGEEKFNKVGYIYTMYVKGTGTFKFKYEGGTFVKIKSNTK